MRPCRCRLMTSLPEQLRVLQPGLRCFLETVQHAHNLNQLLPAAWGGPQAGHKHAACVLHRYKDGWHAAKGDKEELGRLVS